MSTELQGPCQSLTKTGGVRSRTGTGLTCRDDAIVIKNRILIYWSVIGSATQQGLSPNKLTEVLATGLDEDVPIDLWPNWTGNPDEYRLVIGVNGSTDRFPQFFLDNFPSDWPGRVHYTAERMEFPAVIAAANLLSGRSGMTVVPDGLVVSTVIPSDGTNEGGALMAGVSTMQYGGASRVAGGNVLSLHQPSGTAWLSEHTSGRTSWVVAGDSNHIFDMVARNVVGIILFDGTGTVANNARFFLNLYNVPLP